MLKKIIHTTGAKTIESALNFIIVWVSSYYLGSEIYGKIALLTLIVFFVSQLNGLVTGNSLLYQGKSGPGKTCGPAQHPRPHARSV